MSPSFLSDVVQEDNVMKSKGAGGGEENESMMRIVIVFNTFNHDDDVWS